MSKYSFEILITYFDWITIDSTMKMLKSSSSFKRERAWSEVFIFFQLLLELTPFFLYDGNFYL